MARRRPVFWHEEDGNCMLWVCPHCDAHLNCDCVGDVCPVCGEPATDGEDDEDE